MDTKSTHILLDFWLEEKYDVEESKNGEFIKIRVPLPDKNFIKNSLIEVFKKHNIVSVTYNEWEFYPQGVTGIFILSSSHCTYHYYPEEKFLSFDIYTCSDIKVNRLIKDLKDIFQPKKVQKAILIRGSKNESSNINGVSNI